MKQADKQQGNQGRPPAFQATLSSWRIPGHRHTRFKSIETKGVTFLFLCERPKRLACPGGDEAV